MNPKTPNLIAGSYPSLKTAMCQIYTEQWDTTGNLKRTLDALDAAAANGAKLAITPECVLHGYGFDFKDDYIAAMQEIAEPLDGPALNSIKEAAKSLDMAVIVGFAERADTGLLHNSAAFINASGIIEWVYRKVHCRPFESVEHGAAFTPGESFHVSTITENGADFCVGAYICFDREIPESTRSLRALGAQLIACPLATGTDNMAEVHNYADNEMVTRCRAAENEVYILVVNHAGRYNGGSFAVGPGGELLMQMGSEPGVTVLDLPLSGVRERYHGDPLGWMGWGYRRPEVYGKYLG